MNPHPCDHCHQDCTVGATLGATPVKNVPFSFKALLSDRFF